MNCFSAHHQQGNIRLRWYDRFMFRGSLYHTVTRTIGFHYNHISATFREEFVGLVGLQATYFVCADDSSSDGDALMLLPGGTDHLKQCRCFGSYDESIGFTLFGK